MKTIRIDKIINEIIDKNISEETLAIDTRIKRFLFLPYRIHMQKIIFRSAGWKPMKKK